MASTNALTARFCRSQGWPCDTVQQWRGNKRSDLFGVVDSVVAHPGGLILVQNCHAGSLASHRRKIEDSWFLRYIDLQGLWLELWEWKRKKVGRRYQWYRRPQRRANAAWEDAPQWDGPYDLYPKRRDEDREA